MLSERRRKLFNNMKTKRNIIFTIVLATLLIGAIILLIFAYIFELLIARNVSIGLLVLLVGQGFIRAFDYFSGKRKEKKKEEEILASFQKLLKRFIYHWDLGSFRPTFFSLVEEIRSFLEKNIVDVLEEADESQFEKIEEIYKITSALKIPVRTNRDNYKSKTSKKFDTKLFEKLINLCRKMLEEI